MKHLPRLAIWVFAAASGICSATALAQAPAVSTFDTDAEGWTATGDAAAPVSWSATGGNPGGHITISDAATGGVTYFVAPTKFLGDQSTRYGQALTFDLQQQYVDSQGTFQFEDIDVSLTGGGLTITKSTAENPANGGWTSYSVPVDASAVWRINDLNGVQATEAQMRSILQNLTALQIRAEYQSGPDTGLLDNVRFGTPQPTPVPANIVSWWAGEDIGSDIAGGLDALPLGKPVFTNGVVGRAFLFDGVDDRFFTFEDDKHDITGDLTIEGWINIAGTSSGDRTIVIKPSGDGQNTCYSLSVNGAGKLAFSSTTAGSKTEVNTVAVLPVDADVHVAITLLAGDLRMFINGVESAHIFFGTNRPATDFGVVLGSSRGSGVANAACFKGVIDELSLYSRALTGAQIAGIHAAGSAGKARYDAARDFESWSSGDPAQSGPWRYGFVPRETSGNPSVASFTQYTTGREENGFNFWNGASGLEVIANISGEFLTRQGAGGTNIYYPPGALTLHPGTEGQYSVLRWTAPAAGDYAVSVAFAGADARPTTTDVLVFEETAFGVRTLLPRAQVNTCLYENNGFATPAFHKRAYEADEKVYFLVGYGANANPSFDSTAVFANIVPLRILTGGSTAPATTVGTAANVTGSGATLQGSVNPNGAATIVFFEYGTTTSYGQSTAVQNIGAGSAPVNVIANLSDLEPGTLYHFRLVATNASGTTRTIDKTFTTDAAPSGVPFAPPSGIIGWFPGELHVHDVVDGDLGLESDVLPFAKGVSGRGFTLDGVTDSFEVQSDDLNQIPLTIEAWIKPEVRTDGSAADFYPTNIVSGDKQNFGGHGIGANVFPDGSHLWIEVQHTDPAQVFRRVPGNHFAAGQWAHVALVLTPGNAKTYVNGALVDDFDFTQGTMDADPFFRVGRHNEDAGYPVGRRFFKGGIDEVSIYNRALTAAEIAGIINAGELGKTRDDAARDFFAGSNTASQRWQYGQLNTGAAPSVNTFARYGTAGAENALRFWRNSTQPDPNAIKNVTEDAYLHWAPGRLSVHPGPGGEYSVVRWTAPASGTFGIFSQFARLNTQAGDVSIHARHGATALFDETLNGEGARSQFFERVTVEVGETIDFIVGVGLGYGFDATGLTPSIVQLGSAPGLTPATGLTITAPILRELQRFTFTAFHPLDAPGLALKVQFSSTPEDEASWSELPGGGAMRNVGGTTEWRLTKESLELPAGSYFFRVLTSATGREPVPGNPAGARAVNGSDPDATGPVILDAAPLAGEAVELVLTIGKRGNSTTGKQSDDFSFTARQVENSKLDSLSIGIQFTTTPNDPASWRDLPGVNLQRSGPRAIVFADKVSGLPPGTNIFFRTLSTAQGYKPTPGPVIGPYTIKAAPVLKVDLKADTELDRTGRTVSQGEEIRYTITVKNEGGAPASDLSFQFFLPDDMEFQRSADTEIGGYFFRLPRGVSDKKVTSVKWEYGDAFGDLAPGGVARGRVDLNVKRGVKLRTVIVADRVLIKYDGIDSDEQKPPVKVRTEVVPPVSVTLTTDKSIAARGEFIDYTLTIKNTATFPLNEVAASAVLPQGTTLVQMDTQSGPNGNFNNAPISNPSETSNPGATRYYFGVDRLLAWRIGSIPVGETRVIEYRLQVQHDLPLFYVDKKGVSKTTEITTRSYNVLYTPPSGGRVYAFDLSAPEVRVPVSGEELIDPPILKLEKRASGDVEIQNDPAFTGGTVTGARQGTPLVYRMKFSNNGNSVARRVQIQERLADGLIFQGFAKISRDGGPEQELRFDSFLFYDSKNKLISGEPYIDRNNNGSFDSGEPYTDLTKDGKYTRQGDIREAAFLVFDLGDLQPGSEGYVRYQCLPKRNGELLSVGTLIKSEGYALVSESLIAPIRGVPPVTFARIISDLSFQIDTKPSTSGVAPDDVAGNNEASKVTFEINYRNTSLLDAKPVVVEFEVPQGLRLDGAAKLDAADSPGALEVYRIEEGSNPPRRVGLPATPVQVEKRKLIFKPELKAGGVGRILVRCVALPSAQLPRDLQRLESFISAKATIPPLTFTRQTVRIEADGRRVVRNQVSRSQGVSDQAGLQILETNRAHLWGMRVAPLTQEFEKNISYMLIAGNSGNSPARNVQMGFFIPPGTEFMDATRPFKKKGETVTWDIGDIGAGSVIGKVLTVNLKHLRSGTIKEQSFTMKGDNTLKIDFGLMTTQVRDRDFFAMLWESITTPLAALGGALNGRGSAGFQRDLNALSNDSVYIRPMCATAIPSSKAKLSVIPLGNGGVVTVSAPGIVTGGGVIASAHNREVRSGVGAQMSARGVGALNGTNIATIIREARTRGFNVFTGGSGRGISRTGDQLLDNDTGTVVGPISAQASDLVAAGGGNMVAAGGGNLVAAGGLNLVAAGGLNLVGNDGASLIGLDGSTLVAAGGLNLVAAGGGNVMSVAGGDMVAAGGMNLVAAGGLNLVAAGGGNLIGLDGATLIGLDGATLIGLDGGTLIGLDGGTLIGLDGGTLIGKDAAKVIARDGAGVLPGGGRVAAPDVGKQ